MDELCGGQLTAFRKNQNNIENNDTSAPEISGGIAQKVTKVQFPFTPL